jgi:hypothetical protein
MQVVMLKENEDGSADFKFQMTPEETQSLLVYGIRCALENGIKEGNLWKIPDESQDDSENIQAGGTD